MPPEKNQELERFNSNSSFIVNQMNKSTKLKKAIDLLSSEKNQELKDFNSNWIEKIKSLRSRKIKSFDINYPTLSILINTYYLRFNSIL